MAPLSEAISSSGQWSREQPPLGSLGQAQCASHRPASSGHALAQQAAPPPPPDRPAAQLGQGPYKTKFSFQTGFRVLLLTSVTWMHLAGSGPPRLLPLRKLKRCSVRGPGSRGAPEAGRIPSMQYGSLKPETHRAPQPPALGPPSLRGHRTRVQPRSRLVPTHHWGLWPAGSWHA